jgi:hypothetical protein
MKFRRFMIVELTLLAVMVCAVLASGIRGDRLHAQTADSAPADMNSLRAQLDALQRQLPDQAHAMSDVDYHFSSLWFAAQNGNWPLADFYLGETRSHLIWAVRLRPVRKLSTGGDLDLAPILLGVQLSGLADLKGAVDKHDAQAFERAYRGMMSQCYGCHVAAEKPYLRVRIPETPGAHMIDPHG